MSGGLLQLVSIGKQDEYLIKNPKITHYKSVYYKHVNFYKFEEITYFNSEPKFGNKTNIIINHNGDFLHRMYLIVKLPKLIASNLPIVSNNVKLTKKILYNPLVLLYLLTLFFKRCLCRYNYNKEIAININYLHNIKYNLHDFSINCDMKDIFDFNKYKTEEEYIFDYIDYKKEINKDEIITFYDYYLKYEKPIPIFKNKYFFYDKYTLYKKLLKKFNFQNMEPTIMLYIEPYINELELVSDHNIIKNLEVKNEIISDLNIIDLEKYKIEVEENITKEKSFIIEGQTSWVKNIGHKLIKNIKLTLNGEIISEQDSNIFNIYKINKRSKKKGYNKMIGNIKELTRLGKKIKKYDLIIPLNFWFNKFVSNSLPLYLLYNTQIMINLEINSLKKLITNPIDNNVNLKMNMICEYINIEKEFLSNSQYYIYDLWQKQKINDNITRIYFNCMIKELYWFQKKQIKNTEIQFNGITRESKKSFLFYNYLQPYYFHESYLKKKYNMYSFSLYPEKNILSGEFNSESQEINLIFKNTLNTKCYALGQNIMYIDQGIVKIA